MAKMYLVAIGVVGIILVGGVLFLINFHKPTPNPVLGVSTQSGFTQRTGQRRGGFFNVPAGSQRIFGQISAVSDNKVTVVSRGGMNLDVLINSDTKFNSGSASDLKVDTRIIGYGKSNSDGSITAQSLTINPSFPGRRGVNPTQNQSPQPSI